MKPLPTINVVIADDHAFFRSGFRQALQQNNLIDIKCVDEVSNGRDLIDSVNRHHPDAVITDINMPVMNGIEATGIIKKTYPATHIIGFSMYDDKNTILKMLQAGAAGYLIKNNSDEIIQAIRTVVSGQTYFCSTTAAKIKGANLNSKTRSISFSSQETAVIQLICKQLTTKEIAASMNLAIRTVEGYRYHILNKIEAKNLVGIAMHAVSNGIVSITEA